jgi:hypothetical protein
MSKSRTMRSLSLCETCLTTALVFALVGVASSFLRPKVYANTSAPGIKVQGNQLVTTSAGTLADTTVGSGVPVVLRGVNFSGSEYACLTGQFWDNQPGNQSTLNTMLTWDVNVMRLPLNEECWLGINGVPAATGGANYRNAMGQFVRLANASGLIVEVNLHWGAGGTSLPKNDNYPGLDSDHATAFWQSVASYFNNNHSVIFNIVNEPHDISWACYLNGGCKTPKVKGVGSWTVVGTQSVVNTIRSTAATTPIIIAGLDYSDNLGSQGSPDWLNHVPNDPDSAIIAGFHTYAPPLDTYCTDATCWAEVLGNILANGYPVIVDEFGETDCADGYITKVMNWADGESPQVGYWGWDWTTFNCGTEPALIKDSRGTPTNYGVGLKNRLLQLQ